ncbi:MAG: tetratricopeptide repeat protein [Phycisphaerae bacterium]|nr:tetratricopeptide repeat protein [Phycisphaerae bacterium]
MYQPSSTSTNTYQKNNYSHLGGQSYTPVNLQAAGWSMNLTAMSLAASAASQRESDERSEVINSAVEALNAGDNAKARGIAQGMLDENGQDASAAHIIGRTYMEERDYEQAEAYFARAATLAPSSERFASDLVTARLLQESDSDVLDETKRMLRDPSRQIEGIRVLGYLADRSPENGEAHRLLGDALMGQGMAAGAVKSYENALLVGDEITIANLVDRFQEIVDLAPNIGVGHALLGEALQKQGKYDEALVEMQRAAELAPENQTYQKRVASVYGDMGYEAIENRHADDAMRYFEEGAAIDPTSTDLKAGLSRAHLEKSKWWLARGLEDKAFNELSAAKMNAPSNDERLTKDLASAFNTLGDHYRQDGRLDWAISSYRRAHDLDSTSFTYRSKLAQAYDARGTEYFDTADYENAEYNYQQASDLFPGSESYAAHLQSAQDAQPE